MKIIINNYFQCLRSIIYKTLTNLSQSIIWMSILFLNTRSFLIKPFFSDGRSNWNINSRSLEWDHAEESEARWRRWREMREMKRDCIGLTPRHQKLSGEERGLLISPTLCPTFLTISRLCCLTNRVSCSSLHPIFLSLVQLPTLNRLLLPFVSYTRLKNLTHAAKSFIFYFLFQI